MEYLVKNGQPHKQSNHCLVVPIHKKTKVTNTFKQIDSASNGYLKQHLKQQALSEKIGSTQLLFEVPNIKASCVLLVQCGEPKHNTEHDFKTILTALFKAIHECSAADVLIYPEDFEVSAKSLTWKVQQCITQHAAANYEFKQFKTARKEKTAKAKSSMTFGVTNKKSFETIDNACSLIQALVVGQNFTKDLGNLPPNICDPAYLAKQAQALAKQYKKVTTKVLNERDLKTLKMNTLLAVGQGSVKPPKLITVEYKGKQSSSGPVVVLGKGITFDTGGNSLKSPANMVGMKFDMCGAATVLGLMKFAAAARLPIHLIGVLAVAENMPGGTAIRPEDVVTTMSGKTVEILNTDAEGRLVLCDAITYATRFKPKVMIDVATLTGACVVALGRPYAAMFSNCDSLAKDLLQAGEMSGDKCWRMPLDAAYHQQLESRTADFTNIGGPEAGCITAACYLEKFTQDYTWAHIDAAGVATTGGKMNMATGRPVAMLGQYLMNTCGVI